jgi:CheY-like chemotaxis protein
MLVMNGLEATKRIKEIRPELPIIAVTANAFDSDRQAAFDAGCDDFLSKPISSDVCLETIARALGEKDV